MSGPDLGARFEWGEAYAMRNLLIHGFRNVELASVWRTIREDPPRFHAQIVALIDGNP